MIIINNNFNVLPFRFFVPVHLHSVSLPFSVLKDERAFYGSHGGRIV